MIKSTQKIIRVGTSAAVTIPAKEMKQQNLHYGDEVKVTIEASKGPTAHQKVMKDYNKFVSQYGKTLENLAKR